MEFIWGAVTILCLYLLLVFIVMEFAVCHDGKMFGRLKVKREGVVLRFMYNTNFNNYIDHKTCYNTYPKNICQLFWGLVVGVVFSILLSAAISWVVLFVLCVFLIGMSIILPISFFFGKIMKVTAFVKDPNDPEFYDYQRFGKDNQYWYPAPWKILTPLAFMLLSYSSASYLYLIIPIGVLIVGLVCYYVLAKPSAYVGKTTWSFLKSIKDKTCTLVELA